MHVPYKAHHLAGRHRIGRPAAGGGEGERRIGNPPVPAPAGDGRPDLPAVRPHAWLAGLRREASRRQRAGLRRVLRPRPSPDPTVDLAGNDYLGLSRHPAVLAAAAAALSGYGLGAGGSRLVRGSTEVHAELERGLAGWLGTPAALVFSSGYLANVAALRALAGPGSLVVSDAHNHASIVDGCRASRAEVAVVPHAGVAEVARILSGRGDRPAVVVTESVFSVDGDLIDLRELHATCRRYGAVLLVDDAHATGLLGPGGAGAAAAAGVCGEPDVVLTLTLSKAFGASGGVVAGPAELIAHLVDTGRTFIYDTALPPAVAAGAVAALELIRTGDGLRSELRRRAELAAERLAALGVPRPAAGVLSVRAPGPEAALGWAQSCWAEGIAVGCFRPPSTPDGTSRLRLTVNTGVPRASFEAAVDVVLKYAP
jgi:8-amino-7-oxononanoate synthase